MDQQKESPQQVLPLQPLDMQPAQPPRRHALFYLIVVLLSVLYLVVGYHLFVDKAQLFRNQMQLEESVARVVEILHDRNDMGEIGGTVYYEQVITFEAEILSRQSERARWSRSARASTTSPTTAPCRSASGTSSSS